MTFIVRTCSQAGCLYICPAGMVANTKSTSYVSEAIVLEMRNFITRESVQDAGEYEKWL